MLFVSGFDASTTGLVEETYSEYLIAGCSKITVFHDLLESRRIMTSCVLCGTSVNARKKISCFMCSRICHPACITESVDLMSLFSGSKGIVWRCDNCTENFVAVNQNELSTFVASKVEAALATLTATFESLKSEFVKSTVSKLTPCVPAATCSTSTTYSQVVKNKTHPAVIIKPKNSNHSVEKTKEDMLENINPVEASFQLAKVKHIRNGGILVSCRDKENTQKFMKMAEENMPESYEVKVSRGISPRIRVVGMNKKYSENELLEIIRKNNSFIIGGESEISVVNVTPTKKNDKVFQAVLELDRITYERVVKVGNLFIGYDSCHIFDALEVYRCFNCNEYNHSSRSCVKSRSCPKCGDDHSIKECQSSAFNCPNCLKINDKNISVNHAAWDLNKCTAFRVERDRLRNDILADTGFCC